MVRGPQVHGHGGKSFRRRGRGGILYPVVDLGQTLDYRSWLKDLYEERKAQDAFFSWRYLAGRLGVDASYLLRVAQGSRHLSEDALEKLATFAGLKGRDLEIFRALAAFNRARGSREQQECFRRLQELRSPGLATIPDDHVEFFRKWFPVVVRTLGGLTGFVDDPKWIASRLDPSIRPEEAQQAVELVKRLGLLRQGPDGRWELADPFLSAAPGMDPSVMRAFQKQMIGLAGESLDRHPPALRDITTLTLALDLDDLPEARERLRTLRESLLRLSGENPAPRQVYQLNLQLFPLTHIPEGERQVKKARRKVAGLALALLGGAGLAACGSELAGGSGIETGNYLTVQVADGQGKAVQGAVVRRIPTSGWAGRVRTAGTPVLDSAVTDASGAARFAVRAGGEDDRFEGQSDSLLGWTTAQGKSAMAVSLAGMRWTELGFDSAAPAQVWAQHTSLRAAVEQGRARIRLPSGVASALVGFGTGAVRPVGEVAGMTDSVKLRWEPGRFPVDDFEGGLVRTVPGRLVGGGEWSFAGSSGTATGSRFLPAGVENDHSLAIGPADSSWSGRSVRLGYSVALGGVVQNLGVRFRFGKDTVSGHDLSCLDSVVFMARGSGNIYLRTWLPAGLDSLSTGISFVPTAGWQRHSLATGAFWWGNATPALLKDLVGLEFWAVNSGELWLDDIELKGCDLGEVYPELGP